MPWLQPRLLTDTDGHTTAHSPAESFHCCRQGGRQVPGGRHLLRDPALRHQGAGALPVEVHCGGRGAARGADGAHRQWGDEAHGVPCQPTSSSTQPLSVCLPPCLPSTHSQGHRLKNMNCKLIRELKTLHAENKLLLTGACCTQCGCHDCCCTAGQHWHARPPCSPDPLSTSLFHCRRHAAAEQPGGAVVAPQLPAARRLLLPRELRVLVRPPACLRNSLRQLRLGRSLACTSAVCLQQLAGGRASPTPPPEPPPSSLQV